MLLTVATAGRTPQRPLEPAENEVVVGARRGGASELSEVKREIRTVVSDVLEGRVERGVGAVVFQGYNTLLKAVEVERRIREEEELLARIEQLEQAQEQKGGYGWAR